MGTLSKIDGIMPSLISNSYKHSPNKDPKILERYTNSKGSSQMLFKVDSLQVEELIYSECWIECDSTSNLSTSTHLKKNGNGLRSLDSCDDFSTSEMYSDCSSVAESDRVDVDVHSPHSNFFESDVSSESSKKSSLSFHSDGHKWRKYGQKMVKGSSFPRNYYKCTVKDCPARKHVENFVNNSGSIEENVKYVNEHLHPKCHSKTYIEKQKDLILYATRKLQPSKEPTKKRKRNGIKNDESKLVVVCNNNIDVSQDGYDWKKYGQKNVKGHNKPRHYYKCTYSNCKVKKQIEVISSTQIITYEGYHNHESNIESSNLNESKLQIKKIEEDLHSYEFNNINCNTINSPFEDYTINEDIFEQFNSDYFEMETNVYNPSSFDLGNEQFFPKKARHHEDDLFVSVFANNDFFTLLAEV